MVKGNLIAVAQPVLLALGSIFAAINSQDSFETQPFELGNLIPFANKIKNNGKQKDKLEEGDLEIKDEMKDPENLK